MEQNKDMEYWLDLFNRENIPLQEHHTILENWINEYTFSRECKDLTNKTLEKLLTNDLDEVFVYMDKISSARIFQILPLNIERIQSLLCLSRLKQYGVGLVSVVNIDSNSFYVDFDVHYALDKNHVYREYITRDQAEKIIFLFWYYNMEPCNLDNQPVKEIL